MADNHMWLVHRPSGKAVLLGKRWTFLGWDGAREDVYDRLQTLYIYVEKHYPNDQDDFALAMEEGEPGQPVLLDWAYADIYEHKGIRDLILNVPQPAESTDSTTE